MIGNFNRCLYNVQCITEDYYNMTCTSIYSNIQKRKKIILLEEFYNNVNKSENAILNFKDLNNMQLFSYRFDNNSNNVYIDFFKNNMMYKSFIVVEIEKIISFYLGLLKNDFLKKYGKANSCNKSIMDEKDKALSEYLSYKNQKNSLFNSFNDEKQKFYDRFDEMTKKINNHEKVQISDIVREVGESRRNFDVIIKAILNFATSLEEVDSKEILPDDEIYL